MGRLGRLGRLAEMPTELRLHQRIEVYEAHLLQNELHRALFWKIFNVNIQDGGDVEKRVHVQRRIVLYTNVNVFKTVSLYDYFIASVFSWVSIVQFQFFIL